MNDNTPSLVTKNAETADLKTGFPDGSFRDAMILKSCAIGMGTYRPGWRWSLHAGAMTGKPSQSHIGFIVSGKMMVRDSAGNEWLLKAGDAFEVSENHDAWVVGDTPCVAMDFIHLP